MGHRIIVDKSSAYGAKGPGFKTRWRMKIYLSNCVFICSEKELQYISLQHIKELLLGPTFIKTFTYKYSHKHTIKQTKRQTYLQILFPDAKDQVENS